MEEFLRDNQSTNLTGKYGVCTIGLKLEWAQEIGMNMVWYHDSQTTFLRTTLPNKSELWKSLRSTTHTNRWMLLSRIKPYTGELESKGFKNYRFYDEKEIRFVPSPKDLKLKNIEQILTKEEYYEYKKSRIPFSDNKEKGDALIPELSISFKLSDIRYILYANEEDKPSLRKLVKGHENDIIFTSYSRIVQEIIGVNHGSRL